MLDNIYQSKRRRSIRYAIEIEALLLLESGRSVPCIILDFCNTGFFVGFKNAMPEVVLHKKISLRFSIGSQPAGRQYEIVAKIVHIMATGIGVEVESMPPSALNALTKAAEIGLKNILPNHQRLSQSEINQLNFKNAFKKMLYEKLSCLIVGFYEYLGEDLEKADEYTHYFANRYAFDDFMTILKMHGDSLVCEFCILVVSQVDYISGFNQKRDDIFTVDMPLTVVEKEDFEDWLSISDTIRKLTHHFEEQINYLVRELCRVFGLTSSSVINPVSPAVLCDSFRETILQLKLDKQSNKILYRGFSKTLFNSLSQLYQQVGLMLSKQASAEKKTRPPYQSRSISNKNGHPASAKKPSISGRSNRQLVPSSDDDFFEEDDNAQYLINRPIAKIAGKLLDILSDSHALKTFQKAEHEPDAGQSRMGFSPDEVISAISKIQHIVEKDSHLYLDSEVFQNRLYDNLERMGHGAKALSQNDARSLNIYSNFFETLFNHSALSEETKSYLEKIHLPLLSLPLKGSDFLESDQHPARNIVNQLAVLEPAVKSNKTIQNINVKNELDRLIARIVQEANTNPDVFTEVEHELAGITRLVIKSINSSVKRIIEIYEGQQKLEVTRRFVQNEIDQRIADKLVPSVLPLLLESGWQHLLVIAELNKEKNPEEKNPYLQALDDLLVWFNEPDSSLKLQAGTIQKTIEFIRENLISVCTNVTERRTILDELTELLLSDGPAKPRKTVKMPPVKPAENSAIHQSDQNWAQVEQLQVGEWLMMLSGTQKFVPMKLAWVGEAIQIYVIVNRDGVTRIELKKSELAEHFRNGTVIKIDNLDEPVVDRATNLMVQNMHQKLVVNATHDPETELLAKDEFLRQLRIELSKPVDAESMLCHIEVLDFRVITTVCGLSGGSQLIQQIARLIKAQLTDNEIIARIGEKTFAVLFKGCNAEQGCDLSKKLIKNLGNTHFEWQKKSFPMAVSIGLAAISGNNFDIQQLLQQANAASLSAEHSGPNNVLVFTSDDESLKRQNKLYEWIGHIDNVFAQNRLFLRCQKISAIEQTKHKHQHYEILLGIKDEEGNIIPPDNFIPAVERSKRMPEIDQWVINNVFGWIDQNREDFESMDGFSINLSGQSINSQDFLEFLKALLAASKVPLNKITFEITETVAAESMVFTKRFIHAIKQFGCKFSLDDFGSGYSSYSYLKNLDVDYLKIDGVFVKDIANNKADIAIVKSMNEIAHSLGLKTIAEYVENNEILEILKEIGVDYAQGYGIQKPIPLLELIIEKTSTELFYFEDDSFWEI